MNRVITATRKHPNSALRKLPPSPDEHIEVMRTFLALVQFTGEHSVRLIPFLRSGRVEAGAFLNSVFITPERHRPMQQVTAGIRTASRSGPRSNTARKKIGNKILLTSEKMSLA